MTTQQTIMTTEVFERMAKQGQSMPKIPDEKMEYQTSRDKQATEVNKVLVQIFNDSDLHSTVRLYGRAIPFAFAQNKTDHCYTGFDHLSLDPTKRMILVRKELQFMADHADETDLKFYQLFQTKDGIYYVQEKFTVGPENRAYNEGVLAANDIRQYEFGSNKDSARKLTGKQILKSLERVLRTL